jgi:phage terminase large subunit-like protein
MLEQTRRTIAEYNFAGQYQQAPAPLSGGLVKAAWFPHYTLDEVPERFERIVQSWDTANKATELKASGTQLIQELVAEGLYAVTRYQPQSAKVMRLHAQTAMIENGFVHLPEAAP